MLSYPVGPVPSAGGAIPKTTFMKIDTATKIKKTATLGRFIKLFSIAIYTTHLIL